MSKNMEDGLFDTAFLAYTLHCVLCAIMIRRNSFCLLSEAGINSKCICTSILTHVGSTDI